MGMFMFTAGVLQLFAGGFWFFAAAGAMHEITGAALIGFGILSLGVGAVIERLDKPQP